MAKALPLTTTGRSAADESQPSRLGHRPRSEVRDRSTRRIIEVDDAGNIEGDRIESCDT